MNAERTPTSIDLALEKHWSALSLVERAILLMDLGWDVKYKEFLGGKTMDQVIQSGQADLPGEVRGRLIMALTDEGFSKEEYQREKELICAESSFGHFSREHGD